MVAEDSQLVGDVSLCGNLHVIGATLTARAGVSVDGNGYEIMFMDGASADWQGTSTFTWSGDGTNANLVRDININNVSRVMFHMGAGVSTIRFLRIDDSGTSTLGFYPLHFHLNGNSMRGTLVEGVVVSDSANHAFVPHGTHGITYRNNIAKNIAGAAFWWDGPGTTNCNTFRKFCTADNSNDIIVEHMLVDGVTNSPGDDRGFRLAAYTLGAGSGNEIRNSTARNVRPSHVKDCSGFQWPESANQNVGGNVWVFENNAAFNPSGCSGIFVWQNDGSLHVVQGFVSPTGINHGAYVNRYSYRNIDVPSFTGHALGWEIRDSNVGNVVMVGHSLTGSPNQFHNVTMDSFTVNNQAGVSSPKPGTYILNNTNIECSDVIIRSMVVGTRIIIDGEEC
jgi:hypothetical protein